MILLTIANRNFQLIFLIIVWAVGYYLTQKLRNQKMEVGTMRKIAGYEAIIEGIGRAAEQNRPIMYDPGAGGFKRIPEGMMNLAAMNILSHVAENSVKLGAQLMTITGFPEIYPVLVDVIKQAHIRQGSTGENLDIRVIGSYGWSVMAYQMGVMQREKVTLALQMGGLGVGAALLYAEAGSMAGAMVISGTARTQALPLAVASSDYCIIGDELYAAGAYISQDPDQVGALLVNDYVKMAFILLLIVNSVFLTFKFDLINKIMAW